MTRSPFKTMRITTTTTTLETTLMTLQREARAMLTLETLTTRRMLPPSLKPLNKPLQSLQPQTY